MRLARGGAMMGLVWGALLMARTASACERGAVEVPGNGVDEDCDGADVIRHDLVQRFAGWAGELPDGWTTDGAPAFQPEGVVLHGGDSVLWTGQRAVETGRVAVAVSGARTAAGDCHLTVMWHAEGARADWETVSVALGDGPRVYTLASAVRPPAGPLSLEGLSVVCRATGGFALHWLVVQNGTDLPAIDGVEAGEPLATTPVPAAVVEEPAVTAAVEEPAVVAVAEEPAVTAVVEEPAVAAVVEEPVAAAVVPSATTERASATPVTATAPEARKALTGTIATYTVAECQACHTNHFVSGHRPPAGNFCETCHTQTTPATKTAHAVLVPASESTCHTCHDPQFAGRALPHLTAMRNGCLSCHDPHDAGRKKGHLKRKSETEICYGCHTSPMADRSVHTAVKRGMCSTCHDPHGSDNASLLRDPNPTATCPKCHAPQVAERKVPHLPAATGACDACHATHSSPNDYLLKLPTARVCAQCHTPKDTEPQVHSAVVLGRCGKCHEPHGSDNPRKLRGDPVAEVCFRCHADDIKGRKVVHAPVGAGYCTICHDPHQAPNPKNLRSPVNTTCLMCHPEKDRTQVKTQHPAVNVYGCTVCHDPHASDNEFRLRKPIIKLCTSCHKGFDDGYHVVQLPAGGGHPIGGRADPLREGRELVCTSCHDPHGTNNPRMWYRASERLVLCVECHRKTLAPESTSGKSDFEVEAAERAKRLEQEKADEEKKKEGEPK